MMGSTLQNRANPPDLLQTLITRFTVDYHRGPCEEPLCVRPAHVETTRRKDLLTGAC